ncbi:MAG: HU family DNA-binding protein [Clostridia bacterium]|nr:HU family DNA-binding protein [Clostridia bacterium]
MNKGEFISAIATEAGLSKKDAESFVNAFSACVTEALAKGDKVQLIGFGTFETRTRAAREGVNPQTKQRIAISASKAPAFKPGKVLRDAIN